MQWRPSLCLREETSALNEGPEVTLGVSNCSFSFEKACSFYKKLSPKANYPSIFFFFFLT